MRRFIRVYADTSVFGGAYDEEFDTASLAFFQEVREGKRRLVVSDIVRREIAAAPEPVRFLFDERLADAEIAAVTPESLQLRQAYLQAGILTPKWMDDALHVAVATVANCDVIVTLRTGRGPTASWATLRPMPYVDAQRRCPRPFRRTSLRNLVF